MIVLQAQRVGARQFLRVAQGLPGSEHVLVDHEVVGWATARPLPASPDFPAIVDFPAAAGREEVRPIEVRIVLTKPVIRIDTRIVVRIDDIGEPAVAKPPRQHDVHAQVGSVAIVIDPAARAAFGHYQVVEMLEVGLDKQGPVLPDLLLEANAEMGNAFVPDREVVRICRAHQKTRRLVINAGRRRETPARCRAPVGREAGRQQRLVRETVALETQACPDIPLVEFEHLFAIGGIAGLARRVH